MSNIGVPLFELVLDEPLEDDVALDELPDEPLEDDVAPPFAINLRAAGVAVIITGSPYDCSDETNVLNEIISSDTSTVLCDSHTSSRLSSLLTMLFPETHNPLSTGVIR